MGNSDIRILRFDQTADANFGKSIYTDEGIAIYTDIWYLPGEDSAARMDMITCVACIEGGLQAEVNTVEYTIREREVLVSKPNDVIANVMVTPDFNGFVLCFTQRYLLEQITESDIWDNAFRFLKKPIIRVRDERLDIYMLYKKLLKRKVEEQPMPFGKVIITSIIKALLYELLSNALSMMDDGAASDHKMQLDKAGDALFKRFIKLLSGTTVKPRSVAWYADRLYVTPKYLSTACKHASGKTAFEWINEYVQIDIRHWLKNSDKSIKEVADLLDFPNMSFFGKYCRKHFGCSPMALRRSLRGRQEQ